MKRLHYLLALSLGLAVCPGTTSFAADSEFNGLGLNLGNLYRVSKAQSRSISPENFTGEKGKAGMSTDGGGPGVRHSPTAEEDSPYRYSLTLIPGGH